MRRQTYRLSPTLFLVFLNGAIYVCTSLLGSSFIVTSENILLVYGQYNYAVLYHGWWWQLITSLFIHVHVAHIAGNILFLLIFGLRAEELMSNIEYCFVYLTSGLSGSLLSLFWPPLTISAGASGAIFGLLGAVLVYLRKMAGRSALEALLFALLFFVITISTGANILAHFGGLVAGSGIGYWLAERRRRIVAIGMEC